ncbi:MAG: acyl carrier protein [Lachnospiraceae bacterium]|nr:acyl carrier protein [Lachnospiraceae bacterium]
MTNLEKYRKAFIDALEIEEEKVEIEELAYQDIPQWDSVGHMGLIAELEDTFDIMMDTDDIIDFNSYKAGKEIMKKYGVVIGE